jgi:hypothetical protein
MSEPIGAAPRKLVMRSTVPVPIVSPEFPLRGGGLTPLLAHSGVRCEVFCLRVTETVRNAEEIEGSALHRGRGRVEGAAGEACIIRLNPVRGMVPRSASR